MSELKLHRTLTAHIKTLNRQRIARRRAVQGKTIDVLGFYIGMPRQGYELLRFMRGLTDNDLMGNFGTWKIGQANRFWMSKKFTANTLNIKDDISDLAAFTSRFVPGGENAASKIQVYGDVRKTYDIEKEEKLMRRWMPIGGEVVPNLHTPAR